MHKILSKISQIVCLVVTIQFILSALQVTTLDAFAQPANIKIKFQSPTVTIPDGFNADNGYSYGSRNGLTYGWSQDHTDSTVVRQTYQGVTLDSFIRASDPDVWEIALDNGNYDISVTVGDAVYASNNTLFLEGTTVSENVYLQAGEHRTFKETVLVSDGKLTLTFGSSADNETALNALEITRVVQAFSPLPNNPQISLPVEERKIAGSNVLMSGESQNKHNSPEYIKILGLQQEISRYMDAKLQNIDDSIQQYEQTAIECNNCDPAAIQAKVNDSVSNPVVVKAGQLNLNSSMTIGTPDQPVVLILDGMNTNQQLSVTVFGSLILKNSLNANAQLNLQVAKPSDSSLTNMGNLWVKGDLHLNQIRVSMRLINLWQAT